MAKFSILRDEDDEDEEEEFCIRSPKRRRTFNPSPSSSSSADQSPPPHHQQQQSSKEDDADADDDSTEEVTELGGSISVTLSDPDVLDCPICFLPLTIPVFQCDNGHIACSSCCTNLGNKCPSCCGKIGNNRCRAIEKVIESVQVSCCYFRYGCRELTSYCKKLEHEKHCIFAPCACPFPDCFFQGSPRRLSRHLCKEHVNHVIRFRYNSAFSVSLGMDENIFVFQEEKDGILFVLSHGFTTAVKCVDPSLSNRRFAYDLVSNGGGTSLKFQSLTHCITGQFNVPPVDYCVIPNYFYHSGGRLKLEICIWSNDASHADHLSNYGHMK